MKTLVGVVVLLFSCFGTTHAQGDNHLPREQRETVRQWLKDLPKFRVAVESDWGDVDMIVSARNEQLGGYYCPAYVEGDFNRDGTEDFAVAIVNRQTKASTFNVAIFHGKAKGGFSTAPAYIAKQFDLASQALVKYGHGATRLSVSSLHSWHAVLFTFVKGKYQLTYD